MWKNSYSRNGKILITCRKVAKNLVIDANEIVMPKCVWRIIPQFRRCRNNRASSVVCPSVHLSTFSRKSLLLRQKSLDRDQTCIEWSPGQRASRMCSRSRPRSKVTWYGHYCAGPKIASCRRQIAVLPPNLHTMISRGRMHNAVVTATSKLKSIYNDVVFTSVCMTPS